MHAQFGGVQCGAASRLTAARRRGETFEDTRPRGPMIDDR